MKRLIITALGLLIGLGVNARETVRLTDGWTVFPVYDVSKNPKKEHVSVPHTWNADDVFSGMKYERGTYVYERMLPAVPKGKRAFLRFGAVNSYAEVAVNQQFVGCHHGGYTAFCFEITDRLAEGENKLTVLVSNAYRTDTPPLAGDFNIYGGITRPVELIITDQECISPVDHSSSGVYIHQDKVTNEEAQVRVEVKTLASADAQIRTTIIDAAGQVVCQGYDSAFIIRNPKLWDGRTNPYMYKVRVELMHDGRTIDSVEERMGLRWFSVDAEQGFMLNGRHLDLHGVCRHEETKGTASLYNEEAMRQDARLIYDMGATGVRFVHYPHSEYDTWQYDSLGIVVWSELNLAGPGGYLSPGYVKNPELEAHLIQNLEEMILQNYNSPSICLWSLCNELSFKYDEPATFLKQLHDKAKALDPQRLTTMAICYDQSRFQHITDLIGWNKYFGWYNSKGGVGEFMDQAHREAGGQPIGLCEYGAAGSIRQHGFERKVSNRIHLEEYQARVHEDNWEQLVRRPYVWCKFIWQLADNPSAIRDEGDERGINDKGLVTHDRSICKDSYYFYQANWSDAPMVYIASRRYTERTDSVTDIKLYTNQPTATLYLNGRRIGTGRSDGLGRIIFKNVELQKGENTIEARCGKKLRDSCVWTLTESKSQQTTEQQGEGLDGAV